MRYEDQKRERAVAGARIKGLSKSSAHAPYVIARRAACLSLACTLRIAGVEEK
jgi:hypothetical protein